MEPFEFLEESFNKALIIHHRNIETLKYNLGESLYKMRIKDSENIKMPFIARLPLKKFSIYFKTQGYLKVRDYKSTRSYLKQCLTATKQSLMMSQRAKKEKPRKRPRAPPKSDTRETKS